MHLHVGLVVGADLLDSDVVFGVDQRLGGGVGLGQSHHAGYVLELHVVIHLHLDAEEKPCVCVHQEDSQGRDGGGGRGEAFSYLSDPGVGVSNLHHHRKGGHAHLMSENSVFGIPSSPNTEKIFVESTFKR